MRISPDSMAPCRSSPIRAAVRHQGRFGFVEPGEETTFAAAGALRQVAQPEQGLAGARCAHHQRAGVGHQPAPEHGVESRYPGPQELAWLLRGTAPADNGLQPRVHREAIVGDRELVRASHMVPTTQLEHLQLPDVSRIEPLVGQDQHRVDMGAKDLQLLPGIAGQDDGCRPDHRGLGLQLLDETTQIELRGRQILDDGRPVDDEERRAPLASHAADGGDDAVETLLRQGIEEIEVVHPVTHERGIEEAEAAQVGQH